MTQNEIVTQLNARIREIYSNRLRVENQKRSELHKMSDEEYWEHYKGNMTFLPFSGAEDQLRSEVLRSRSVDEEEIPEIAIETPIRKVFDTLYPHIVSIVTASNAQVLKDQHVFAALEVSSEIDLAKDLVLNMSKHNGFEQSITRLVQDFETILTKQKQAAVAAELLSDTLAKGLVESHPALPDLHS